MPLENEERVGRRIGAKGSQLVRSDYGSITIKQSYSPKPSKFQVKKEDNDSSSVDGSESDE